MTTTPPAPRFSAEQHAAATALDAAENHYAACFDALAAATTARNAARLAFRATFAPGPVGSPFAVLRDLSELRERTGTAAPASPPDPADTDR